MAKINHVAIIMDGNGRWAKEKGRPRFWGHVRGSEVVSQIVEAADDLGVGALTLYAFSTENWSRPLEEISLLFKLLDKFLIRERKKILENNIKFRVIGDTSSLPKSSRELIGKLEEESRYNSGLKLNFAFSYGSRAEIVMAVNRFMVTSAGKQIREEDISHNLYMDDLPEVDLLIRTGGEKRLSNFLLWQVAYSELWFSDTKWPAFSVEEFETIYMSVMKRERRFGGLGDDLTYLQSMKEAKLNKNSIHLDKQQ